MVDQMFSSGEWFHAIRTYNIKKIEEFSLVSLKSEIKIKKDFEFLWEFTNTHIDVAIHLYVASPIKIKMQSNAIERT